MKITGREIRAIWWMIKHLAAEFLQEMWWTSSRVWPYTWHSWRWISIDAMLCAFKIFITDHTSQSVRAGTRASTFKCCNYATARTRKVPLVHASFDVITLSRTRCRLRNKWYITKWPRLLWHCPWRVVRCSQLGEGEVFENKAQGKRVDTNKIVDYWRFYNRAAVIYENRRGWGWEKGWVIF